MRRRASPPSGPEDGFTLVEVLITLALISVAFVGVLTAVAGMITAGAQNQTASTVGAAIRNVGTDLQSSSTAAYIPCNSASPTPQSAYTSDAMSAGLLPAGYMPTVNVLYWNGGTPAMFGACPPPPAGDQGLELLTVKVSSPSGLGGQFTRSLAVLKRSTP